MRFSSKAGKPGYVLWNFVTMDLWPHLVPVYSGSLRFVTGMMAVCKGSWKKQVWISNVYLTWETLHVSVSSEWSNSILYSPYHHLTFLAYGTVLFRLSIHINSERANTDGQRGIVLISLLSRCNGGGTWWLRSFLGCHGSNSTWHLWWEAPTR